MRAVNVIIRNRTNDLAWVRDFHATNATWVPTEGQPWPNRIIGWQKPAEGSLVASTDASFSAKFWLSYVQVSPEQDFGRIDVRVGMERRAGEWSPYCGVHTNHPLLRARTHGGTLVNADGTTKVVFLIDVWLVPPPRRESGLAQALAKIPFGLHRSRPAR